MLKRPTNYEKKLWLRMYNMHRERVKNAHSVIDNKPPPLHGHNFLRLARLREDSRRLWVILKQNIGMVVRVMEAKPGVDCYNTATHVMQSSRNRQTVLRAKLIESENVRLAKRLEMVKPHIVTRDRFEDCAEVEQHAREVNSFQIPLEALSNYRFKFKLPDDAALRYALFRPQIYLTLGIKGVRKLGRLNVQLYSEAAPQVVIEFVRQCQTRQLVDLEFSHLFPNLWMGGRLKLDEGSWAQRKLEVNRASIRHGDGPGVLSFNARFIDGFPEGKLPFVLTFRPIEVLDRKYVAFGRVKDAQDMRVLNAIRDYGLPSGRPKKPIIITDCGCICRR